jgi:hypothetical protein
LYFDIKKVIRNKEAVAAQMKELLKWSDEEMRDELLELEKMLTNSKDLK